MSHPSTDDVAEGKPKERLCPKHHQPYTEETDCSVCHGEGLLEDDDPGFGGGYVKCYACDGTGMSPFLDCWLCLEEDQDDNW